jgi:hypothetical protein
MPRNDIGIVHQYVYRTLLVEDSVPFARRQLENRDQASAICFEIHAFAAVGVAADFLQQSSLQCLQEVEEVSWI